MAFADSQTVTINAVPITLKRVGMGISSGSFAKDDGLVKLAFSHSQKSGKTRSLVRLDHGKIAADPLLAGINVRAGLSVYTVVEVPATGYSLAEAKQVTDGYFAYMTASSGAVMTQLLGHEI
jgi:hypothetical protein